MPRIVIRSLVAVTAFVGLATEFRASETTPATSVAEQTLHELRAANEARAALESERAAAKADDEKLKFLLETVQREARRYAEQAEKSRVKIAEARAALSSLDAAESKTRAVEDAADTVAGKLQDALDQRAPSSFPGVIPTGTGAGETPGDRLRTALARLDKTETECCAWRVDVVTGLLDGKSLAVKLLRAGDARAWWLSLDESRAGTATPKGGALLLTSSPESAVADVVRKALAVREGRVPPTWVPLPLSPDAATGKEKP